MDLSTDRLTITTILIQSNSSLHMSGKTDIEEVYLTKLLGIHEDLQDRLELKGLKLFACLHFRDISIFYDKLKFYHR